MEKNGLIKGKLYLVSIGIGDIDNLTIKAYNTIKNADIIIGMKFVCDIVSELIENKIIIEAGHGLFTNIGHSKQPLEKIEEDEKLIRNIINSAITDGKTVAVLDFGDPCIFGPQSGYFNEFKHIKPLVIPGISSFNAANAALARTLLFEKNAQFLITSPAGFEQMKPPYPTISVFFMMKASVDELLDKLSECYGEEASAAIVIYAGYYERQKVLEAKIKNMKALIKDITLPWEYLVYAGNFEINV